MNKEKLKILKILCEGGELDHGILSNGRAIITDLSKFVFVDETMVIQLINDDYIQYKGTMRHPIFRKRVDSYVITDKGKRAIKNHEEE